MALSATEGKLQYILSIVHVLYVQSLRRDSFPFILKDDFKGFLGESCLRPPEPTPFSAYNSLFIQNLLITLRYAQIIFYSEYNLPLVPSAHSP